MESIYRRHNNCIPTFIIGLILFVCPYWGLSQVTEEYKEEITSFIQDQFPRLLLTSSDYASIRDSDDRLRTSLEREINNLDLNINSNMVVEYDQTTNNGENVVISDKLIPFLINYTGRNLDNPILEFECLTSDGSNLLAYYHSENVISDSRSLRKMIFRISDGGLELRRISFQSKIPDECLGRPEVDNEETVSETIEITSNPPSTQEVRAEPVVKRSIPSIRVTEARYINGNAYIYGFILNHKQNGILTDLDSQSFIKVSDLDGFFAFQKNMNSKGYQTISLRYDYDQKFLSDKILIFIGE